MLRLIRIGIGLLLLALVSPLYADDTPLEPWCRLSVSDNGNGEVSATAMWGNAIDWGAGFDWPDGTSVRYPISQTQATETKWLGYGQHYVSFIVEGPHKTVYCQRQVTLEAPPPPPKPEPAPEGPDSDNASCSVDIVKKNGEGYNAIVKISLHNTGDDAWYLFRFSDDGGEVGVQGPNGSSQFTHWFPKGTFQVKGLDLTCSASITFGDSGATDNDIGMKTPLTSTACWFNDSTVGLLPDIGQIFDVNGGKEVNFIPPNDFSRHYLYLGNEPYAAFRLLPDWADLPIEERCEGLPLN